jgi:hypothetical protein
MAAVRDWHGCTVLVLVVLMALVEQHQLADVADVHAVQICSMLQP